MWRPAAAGLEFPGWAKDRRNPAAQASWHAEGPATGHSAQPPGGAFCRTSPWGPQPFCRGPGGPHSQRCEMALVMRFASWCWSEGLRRRGHGRRARRSSWFCRFWRRSRLHRPLCTRYQDRRSRRKHLVPRSMLSLDKAAEAKRIDEEAHSPEPPGKNPRTKVLDLRSRGLSRVWLRIR